ncbi:MAG: GGDEF domain-containing protein [Lachnospiraceae bacterium]|nr:GGDEF domain-containing protein [Lachnospiraceae bacterium]
MISRKNQRLMLCVLLTLVLLWAIVSVLKINITFDPDDEVTVLNGGWSAEYKGVKYEGFNINDIGTILPGNIMRGDLLTLSHEIYDISGLDFPTLLFKTQYCAYQVYIDDKMVEEQYLMDYAHGNFVGCGYHYVTLPSDSTGKKLSIKLYAAENKAYKGILAPMIGDYHDLESGLLHSNIFVIASSIYLVCFGLVFFIISTVFSSYSREIISQIVSSLLCILMGLWILFSNNLAYIFVFNSYSTLWEFILIILIPAVGFLMLSTVDRSNLRKLYRIIAVVDIIFLIFILFLHVNNIIHIRAFIFVCHIMSAACLIFMVYNDIKFFRHGGYSGSEIVQTLGLTALGGATVLSIPFYITKKSGSIGGSISDMIIPIGAMLFAMAILLNFMLFITESYARKREYASLARLAYIDEMTELYNRAMSDKKMDDMDHSSEDYCIISIDVNGLKRVNDEMGHAKGDILLKNVAGVLGEVFSDKATVCRIGGDEFTAFVEKGDERSINSLINDMKLQINDLNSENDGIYYSVSYGLAFRHDCPGEDSHAVFMLADKRMYESKRQYYKNIVR